MMLDRKTNCCLRWARQGGRLIAIVTAILIAPCFLPESAQAQGRQIKITMVQNLEFGIVGATNVNGTVTMRSDGTKLLSAGVLDLGGISMPAAFLVQGERFTAFTITLPASATVTLPGGPSAVLTDFESTPSISGIFDQTGQATVTVGATLNLTPSLWEGFYTDPFDIMATYQ
jgi:hypothetical protein